MGVPPDFPDAWRVTDPADPFETGTGPFMMPIEDDGDPRIALLVEPRHCNTSGATHGGLLATMADLALCARACHGMPNERAVTVSLTTSFVSGGGVGDFLIARAELVRRTRSLTFVNATITVGDRILLTASGITKRTMRDPDGPALAR